MILGNKIVFVVSNGKTWVLATLLFSSSECILTKIGIMDIYYIYLKNAIFGKI